MIPASDVLFGRDGEVERVAALIDLHPLVTLVGPAGVGKTRLAAEVASATGARYPGGVITIDLTGHAPDDDVEAAAARQIGLESIEALRLRSAGEPSLIVLDNCESVIEGAAALIDALDVGRSSIRVLATTRTPLRANSECVIGVSPLTPASADENDPAESPAVQMFMSRARSAGALLSDDRTQLDTVAELVRRLDGLPLAIELAAARAHTLAPAQILELLDRQLDLLTASGRRDGRFDGLRSAIQASVRTLPDETQEVFRRLAVFRSPFDLEIASAAFDPGIGEVAILDELTTLVDHSLVTPITTEDGRVAYRMLDSIRAFAAEELERAGEDHSTHARFAAAIADWSDRIVAAALASFSPAILSRIRRQIEHLLAAIDWCVAHDESADRAHRMFIPLYGPTGARPEIVELGRRVRQRWPEGGVLRAEVRAVMATATFLTGTVSQGCELARAALADRSGTPLAAMIAHRTLGLAAALDDDTDRSCEHFDQAIGIGETFSAAFTRELRVSRIAALRTDGQLREHAAELDEVSRAAAIENDLVTVLWASVTAAHHRQHLGDTAGATHAADTALVVADRTGLDWSVAEAHRVVADVAAIKSGWTAAAPHYRAAFDAGLRIGDIGGIANTLRSAAGSSRRLGDTRRSTLLWGTTPPISGVPLLRPIFHREETALEAELGRPMMADIESLVATARHLLDPSIDVDDDPVRPGLKSSDRIRYRFGSYTLDPARRELLDNGEAVHVEPQVFDVLQVLVERPGVVVTKRELLEAVWGSTHVSESALSSRISTARRAVGDDGRRQTAIKTVFGTGFMFIADVESFD